MQATQNGSDLWLSYWVSHDYKERLRLADGAELGSPALPRMPAGQWGLMSQQAAGLQGGSGSRTWAGTFMPFRCSESCCLSCASSEVIHSFLSA